MSEVVGCVINGINEQGNTRKLILCLNVRVAKKESVDISKFSKCKVHFSFQDMLGHRAPAIMFN